MGLTVPIILFMLCISACEKEDTDDPSTIDKTYISYDGDSYYANDNSSFDCYYSAFYCDDGKQVMEVSDLDGGAFLGVVYSGAIPTSSQKYTNVHRDTFDSASPNCIGLARIAIETPSGTILWGESGSVTIEPDGVASIASFSNIMFKVGNTSSTTTVSGKIICK